MREIGDPLAGTLGPAWAAGEPTTIAVTAGAAGPALVFAVTAVHVPLGVLVLRCTSGLWALGQQLVVRRRR